MLRRSPRLAAYTGLSRPPDASEIVLLGPANDGKEDNMSGTDATFGGVGGQASTHNHPVPLPDEMRLIIASSVCSFFEWYNFSLCPTLAPFFAKLFFPAGNDTAALLSTFATYAAGFLVRPFGAIVFGRIGDLVGRKYTLLVTIIFMGGATFLVGLLPTYQNIGLAAPVLMVLLQLVQGLALGGEYGGAAT